MKTLKFVLARLAAGGAVFGILALIIWGITLVPHAIAMGAALVVVVAMSSILIGDIIITEAGRYRRARAVRRLDDTGRGRL